MQVNALFGILSTFDEKSLVDNATIEVNWTVYTLKEKDGEFFVKSPNYADNAYEELTDDLTLALWVHLEQFHLLRKLNIEGEAIRFDDKVIYADGAFDANNVYLQRIETSTKGDSGWFIGVRNGDNSKLKACYAYQLLKLNKEFIQYLVLPKNYLVVLENNEVKAILNGDNENITNN
ncbi:hypothetical protein EDD63_1261 [Breznakia blatticola]|uniref:Imm33-like domain-containing protein n=1 Tax=Breznakia blatticola TaxID=1754012 RepID=A0A4R7ZF20_9FIRM|nr:hypothetical protein [Breznakia blatticola]TDW16237.1 hypothetical protein EDD63_1261 [Breznakia blatticola]